jgi:4'-phosphopantetheinyl transferase EntD
VAGLTERFGAMGVDLERVDRVTPEVVRYACRAEERRQFLELPAPGSPNWPALTFSAKEAVYKAIPGAAAARLDFADLSLRISAAGPGHGRFSVDPVEAEAPWAVAARSLAGFWWAEGGTIATLALQRTVKQCDIIAARGHAP